MNTPPEKPKNSVRITLTLERRNRIDTALLAAIREQTLNSELKNISRSAFKELFKQKRIQLKGQSAVTSSMLAEGVSYVDILGFDEE